ncbi:MAG: rRNA maturation RNase YbeY [Chitinophagaceae bacterium]
MPASAKPAIYFFFEIPVTLTERTRLKEYISSIFKKEKRQLKSINYIFCSDERLLEINKQFLKHDYYTDIITFRLSNKMSPVEAEIYISVPRVKDNSLMLKENFKRELLRVIFHGALHLCGHKDRSPKEKELMRKKENLLLKAYFP